MSRLTVHCYASIRDAAAAEAIVVDAPDELTVSQLRRMIEAQYPALAPHLSSAAVSVNRRVARPDDRIGRDDEIALLPPVSGG